MRRPAKLWVYGINVSRALFLGWWNHTAAQCRLGMLMIRSSAARRTLALVAVIDLLTAWAVAPLLTRPICGFLSVPFMSTRTGVPDGPFTSRRVPASAG